MLNITRKATARLAAAALAIAALAASPTLAQSIAAAPAAEAQAVYGASVMNLSIGEIQVKADNGTVYRLIGYGTTLRSNANWILVPRGGSIRYDGKLWNGGIGYWMRVMEGQHIAQRVS